MGALDIRYYRSSGDLVGNGEREFTRKCEKVLVLTVSAW